MNQSEKSILAKQQSEWAKPELRRLEAGSAEGASNGGQDFGTGQS